ncbi:MAG: YncE family protein, partial [Planctomycetota bacterium]|nr:YncE family protein [Planctomycetota bacterium]
DCIDPVTLDLIDSFPALGVNPLGLAITPDGQSLFVATAGDGRVTRWSIPGHQAIGDVGGLGAPREMIAAPEGDLVYVSDPTGVRAWEITVDTLVATQIAVDEFPQALALTENGQHLLVGNFGFDRSLDHASVIHRQSREVVAKLRIGTGPEEMVLIPNTPYLAVTNWGFSRHPNTGAGELGAGLGNVAIVRLPDFNLVGDPNSPPMIDAIERIIPVGGDYTFGIAASPDGDKVYAANLGYGAQSGNTVSVIQFPEGWVNSRFVRGDPNADGVIDVADPIALLGFLFGGDVLNCANAGDVNDDEVLNIADPIALLSTLFSAGAPLPAPSVCGADPTSGELCCNTGCSP